MRKSFAVAAVVGLFLTGLAPVKAGFPPVIFVADTPEGRCGVGSATVKFGEGVTWDNRDNDQRHVLKQRERFWRVRLPPGDAKSRVMYSAGRFLVNCDGGAYRAWVKVRLGAPRRTDGETFEVTWATPSTPSAHRFDVRVKLGKSGNFHMWKRGTSDTAGTFDSRHNRTYFFQARSKRRGHATEWSPLKKVVVS